LTRYKIPVLPFYLLGLALIYFISKSERNKGVLDTTE
jgi:hypothetical protein